MYKGPMGKAKEGWEVEVAGVGESGDAKMEIIVLEQQFKKGKKIHTYIQKKKSSKNLSLSYCKWLGQGGYWLLNLRLHLK